jgi:polyhydroxyalkanoate synthase
MDDPLDALAPLIKGIGGAEQLEQVRRGLRLHATLPRPPVGLTPYSVVHRQNKLELKYYAPSKPGIRTPVIIVPSMINRAYICDLEPDRSLVGALAKAGHPTFLVDWGIPGPEDGQLGVGEVLLDLLHRAVDRACRHVGAEQAFVVGYCQGGTLSAMYTALRPSRIAGLVMLNAPVQFAEAGRFKEFVDPKIFDVEASIPEDELVPVDLMQVAFKLLDPMGNWNKYIALEKASHKPAELARALVRERWLEENVPMPGAFAREFIRCAYQEDRLVKGSWRVRGELVDFKKIRCPLLVVACEKDFIAPASATVPMMELVGSEQKELHLLSAGHIGIVVGSAGPKLFYPLLDRWFRGR